MTVARFLVYIPADALTVQHQKTGAPINAESASGPQATGGGTSTMASSMGSNFLFRPLRLLG
jgi:hypothetical protein